MRPLDLGSVLESDCDEQLLMHIAFTTAVKLHSLEFVAPNDGRRCGVQEECGNSVFKLLGNLLASAMHWALIGQVTSNYSQTCELISLRPRGVLQRNNANLNGCLTTAAV